MKLNLHQVDPLTDSRWWSLLETHPKASLFHSPRWLEALLRTYRYLPVAYTSSAPGEPLKDGLVFSRVESWLTGRRLVSLPFSDHCDLLCNDELATARLLRELKALLQLEKWQYLELRPLYASPNFDSFSVPSTRYYFHLLDLGPGREQLFKAFHKDSIQRKIKKAEREALGYDQDNTFQLMEKFYALFVNTRRKHRLPPQPRLWFENLRVCFGDQLQVRVAYKGTRPIAAILTIQFKNTLVYKYGCSDNEFSNLGGTHLLFWQSILEAQKKGLRYFDMGRSDIDNTGLTVFKDKWGAQKTQLTYWKITPNAKQNEAPKRASADWKLKVAKQFFAYAPESLLTAIGRIFYKHVG